MSRGKITIAVAVVAVLVAGAAAYFTGYLSFGPRTVTVQAKEEIEPPSVSPGPQYLLKERVINLSDPGGRRYVKIGISLEFSWGGAEFRKAKAEERKKKQEEFDLSLASWLPLIDDAVINLVSARTVADITTTEGKQKLKTDIKDAVNHLLGGEPVVNVLFTQFVIQ